MANSPCNPNLCNFLNFQAMNLNGQKEKLATRLLSPKALKDVKSLHKFYLGFGEPNNSNIPEIVEKIFQRFYPELAEYNGGKSEENFQLFVPPVFLTKCSQIVDPMDAQKKIDNLKALKTGLKSEKAIKDLEKDIDKLLRAKNRESAEFLEKNVYLFLKDYFKVIK